MTADPFATPGAAGGGFKPAEHVGELLLIDVKGIETGMVTVNGISNPARGDVVVLDGEHAGTEYDDTLIFGKMLSSQLSSRVNQKVLGRLAQGKAKPGQSAPWVLEDPTDADRALGMKHLSKQVATAAPPF